MSVAPMVINISDPVDFESLTGYHPEGKIIAAIVFDPIRDQHFRVSENTALEECLVFRCSVDGRVVNWSEVASGWTMLEVLRDWANGSLRFINREDWDE